MSPDVEDPDCCTVIESWVISFCGIPIGYSSLLSSATILKIIPATLSCKRGERIRSCPAAWFVAHAAMRYTFESNGALRIVRELPALTVQFVRVVPGAVTLP